MTHEIVSGPGTTKVLYSVLLEGYPKPML